MIATPVREILGYPVLAATPAEAVELCERAIQSRTPFQIGVLNAAKVVNASKDPALRDALLSCDAIFADGQAVVWASRILGKPLPQRVTGIDLFEDLLELASRKRYSVYLLGATREVLDRVVEIVEQKYPDVVIAGHRDGYFTPAEAVGVARDIGASAPDMLFVAMTSPKKETFIAANQDLLRVPLTHGVGGSFDIVAGKTERAPEIWQRLGMEWAFRVVQEPRRMFMRYFRTNGAFILMVFRDYLRSRKQSRLS